MSAFSVIGGGCTGDFFECILEMALGGEGKVAGDGGQAFVGML